ncbi:dipeptidase PepV [Sporanaerobium hydrogeniformans]|uniref:Dipeptidase PepV n=1 Tax=Sporanaerobium hydrogeniformans TaxID=3072179 RepID=A0AC61D9M0_9FIRM|nr:Sapep family Mn(2+)-dependent dipeptidase [Sporanaerobium hydrogeniformans]PHV69991.1 dipeptidase PepV [Sporanaerobium hydrogeniformans]
MFNNFIGNHTQEMIENLMQLINIPTVMGAKEEKAPFGRNIAQGLDYILSLAEKWGMQVKNYEGYAGEITIGTGDYRVGILCHIDVVDAGEGWETPPFKATIKDEKIYGRGAIDDKGPLISCLYVMKYLNDHQLIPPSTSLRMIIGTNEEENWEGIQYYVAHAPILPHVSIVPDGNFPAICYEKGLLDFNLISKHPSDARLPIQLISIEGGNGRNVVPGKCMCQLKVSSEVFLKERIEERLEALKHTQISYEQGLLTIETSGKSTHCMTPEKGRNAIALLMHALYELGPLFSHHEMVKSFKHYIGKEYNGQSYGCGFEDALSGKLTFNIGKIYLDKDSLIMEANLRYPVSTPYEVVKEAVEQTSLKAGFEYNQIDHLAAICMEKDAPLMTCLLKAYRMITGDEISEPLSIGGATYARAIPNAVAFGPLQPYEEELAHEANEYLSIDSLFKMTEIYERALTLLLNEPIDRANL